MNPQQEQQPKMENKDKSSSLDMALIEGMLRYNASYNERCAFVAGANWQKEHSYSEQEVTSMLESLRHSILDLEILREVNTNKIEEIDIHQLIPPKQ